MNPLYAFCQWYLSCSLYNKIELTKTLDPQKDYKYKSYHESKIQLKSINTYLRDKSSSSPPLKT